MNPGESEDDTATEQRSEPRRTDAPLHALMSVTLDVQREHLDETRRMRLAWDRIASVLDRGLSGCAKVGVAVLLALASLMAALLAVVLVALVVLT